MPSDAKKGETMNRFNFDAKEVSTSLGISALLAIATMAASDTTSTPRYITFSFVYASLLVSVLYIAFSCSNKEIVNVYFQKVLFVFLFFNFFITAVYLDITLYGKI